MMLGEIPGVHWDVGRQANDNVAHWMEWVSMLLFQFLIIAHFISNGVFVVGTRLSNLAAPFVRDRDPRFGPPLVAPFHENTRKPHGLFLQLGLAKKRVAG